MSHDQSHGAGPWKYLINPDKSATPQLEQLCLGLAKVISCLEPGPDTELSPQRLAAFYRAVGGNYDNLFLKTADHNLSFMYKTLGCFHSLQPSANAFEDPRIPCLTPAGFARWATIQILLVPDEYIGFFQQALLKFNVPAPNGGVYPKYIPADVFPARPDEDMEKWHKFVSVQLNQKNYLQHRIKNSPYQSPYPDERERRDGYFSNGKALGPTKGSVHEQDQIAEIYRRRSSVPDFPSPVERSDHRSTNEPRKARSHSAQRPPVQPVRQRSHTASGAAHSHSHSQNSPTSPANRRHPPQSHDTPHRGSGQQNRRSYRSPTRTPSTVDEDTGSEASSETSQLPPRHHRRSDRDDDRKGRRSSLWVPSFLKSHKRRHSSDASYRAKYDAPPPKPLRPEYYSQRAIKAPPQQPPQIQPGYRGNVPQWREQVWDSDANVPVPVTPTTPAGQPDPRLRNMRYPDRDMDHPLSRQDSSGSGADNWHRSSASDWERSMRRNGAPTHGPPMTGVGGRKYANPEPVNNVERQRSHRSGVPAAV